MKIEEPVAERLLAENAAYRRLAAQHRQYERQLAEFDRVPHLLPDQELERRTVQKLKLAVKDKMAAIVREAAGR